MTQPMYTAWDDKQYPSPPPEGWYQADDSKWWPQGYGPTSQAETAPGQVASSQLGQDSQPNQETAGAVGVAGAAVGGVAAAGMAGAGLANGKADVADTAPSYGSDTSTPEKIVSSTDAASTASSPTDYSSSDYASSDYSSSDYSSTDFASTPGGAENPTVEMSLTDPASSSFGSGTASDSASSSYGSGTASDSASSSFRSGTTADPAADHELDSVAADVARANTNPSGSLAGGAIGEAPGAADPMSRLDQLQRQVEDQSIAGTSRSSSLPAFDPTETIDGDGGSAAATAVGGIAAAGALGATVVGGSSDVDSGSLGADLVGAVDRPATSDPASAFLAAQQEAGVSGASPVDRSSADSLPTDRRQSPASPAASPDSDSGSSAAAGDFAPPTGQTEPVRKPNPNPILTQPTPSDDSPRRLLYAVLLMVALMAALAAGYLLYQLTGGSDEDATAAEGSSEVTAEGEQTTSSNLPGSVSNPHDPANGIRINYPDGDAKQIWTIEVLDASTTADGLKADMRISNDSETGEASLSDLSVVNVDAEGSETGSRADCAEGASLDLGQKVAAGDAVEGAVCWSGETAGSLIGIETTKAEGRVYISLP